MGGKSKKKSGGKDKAKEEKRKKQELKAQKKAGKKSKKKGDGDDDLDDLDAILEEIRKQDAARTAVTVEVCEHPSPRSNFSLSPLDGQSNSELLMFGGEYFDGNTSECYNDLFRLNLDKMEWKQISSPNTPGPRNAHQAVAVRDQVYVFGGEFSLGYQFQHYRDLWKLDLNGNAWTNIELKTGPSPRSGHRMVLWKHFLVLFGGFYETSRGVKFYDDLYFFDLREEKWHQGIGSSKQVQKPSARSGFQFVCHAAQNTVYMYGGYSKVAVSSLSQRGRNLDDMWALHLTQPGKAGECPTFRWESIQNKGSPPTRRSGAASTVHKNRMIIFGGVTDKESANDVDGMFYNDIHAFDMDRKRWFELRLQTKTAGTNKKKKRKGRGTGGSVATTTEMSSKLEKDFPSEDEDDDDEAYSDNEDDCGLDDNAFYVIIDGKVTKIDIEDDEDGVDNDTDKEVDDPKEDAVQKQEVAVEEIQVVEKEEPKAPVNEPPSAPVEEEQVAEEQVAEEQVAGEQQQVAEEKAAPMPRIGAGLGILGSKLFVLGGTTEIGDRQITFDDLWSIDLNQMDKWEPVIEGSWKSLAWKGGENEEEDDEEEDEDDDIDIDEEEEDDEAEENSEVSQEKTAAEVAAEVGKLREQLQLGDETKTPLPREPLRDFFKRTVDVWVRLALEGKTERMSGKEVRREAFKMAQDRFNELWPILRQLDELEEEQKMFEEMQSQEKEKLREKLKAKVKKRKAHMTKMSKKAAKAKEKQGEAEDSDSD